MNQDRPLEGLRVVEMGSFWRVHSPALCWDILGLRSSRSNLQPEIRFDNGVKSATACHSGITHWHETKKVSPWT